MRCNVLLKTAAITSIAIAAACLTSLSAYSLPAPVSQDEMKKEADVLAVVRGQYSKQSGCIQYGDLYKEDFSIYGEHREWRDDRPCSVPLFRTKAIVKEVISQKKIGDGKFDSMCCGNDKSWRLRKRCRGELIQDDRINICWTGVPSGMVGGWSVPLYRKEVAEIYLKYHPKYKCYLAVAWNAKKEIVESTKNSGGNDVAKDGKKNDSNTGSGYSNGEGATQSYSPPELRRECRCDAPKEALAGR